MTTGRKLRNRLYALMMLVILTVSLAGNTMTTQAASTEVAVPVLGIDVSRYQGEVDWNAVAASGISYAMIRVGYRTQETGLMTEDPYARYNLQEAIKAGLHVGVYFFSTAVTDAEAVEEATWVANLIDKYQITYPVAYDCEGYRNASSRQYRMSNAERTARAITFMETIAARGYTPMFYASKSALTNSRDWDTALLSSKYKIWLASYPAQPFPITPASDYAGVHSMWQYTSKALIAGVKGYVDLNVSYFSYTMPAQAKDPSGAPHVASVSNVSYTEVLDVVTPNTEVNLRTVPSTDSPDTIVAKIKAGDMVYRIGVGNDGWSKVLVNGFTLYAYTSYLNKVL